MTEKDKAKGKEIENNEEEPVVQEKTVKKSAKPKSRAKATKRKTEDKKINELNEKLDELNDKYLRLFSEYDNYRKRTLKEKIELGKTASEDIIVSILPVFDDFERAMASFEEMNVDKSFKEGVELIYNKFMTILEQKGLKPIESVGNEFSTDYHEAVTNAPAPSDDMKGKVMDEVEKGYLLNDKVIRYAKVIVGS
jgi:molecular chaperone GrpE